MGLLDGDLATEIGNAINDLMLDGTIVRGSTSVDEYGDEVPGDEITYTFRGFDEDIDDRYRTQAGIPEGDILINVVASKSATIPQPNDRLVLRGVSYAARSVRTDPARALYVVQAFRVNG